MHLKCEEGYRGAEEYTLLLQYDLKREKEKNGILEQRLKNKEVFIVQMKEFQQELTSAYDKCKDELVVAHNRIHYMETTELREHVEQIAELKHMLMGNSKRPSFSKYPNLTANKNKESNPDVVDSKAVNQFIAHFLEMAQTFDPDIISEERNGKRLKKAWKWVKEVVREWRGGKEASKKHEELLKQISRVHRLENGASGETVVQFLKKQ